jgi:predicted acylesterase/phospholipase RssA
MKGRGKNSMANRKYSENRLRVGFLVLAVLPLLVMLFGCGDRRTSPPLPAGLENEVRVPGFSEDIRAWADQPSKSFARSAVASVQEERAVYGDDVLKNPAALLALSGGGDNGAFGAGVLCGWTQHGDRPRFKVVTGISTGALMAPFAFLSSNYDADLKVYTLVNKRKIFHRKSLLTLPWWDSLTSTQPLAELIAKYINERVLKAVAAGHKKGRRLFIGTTQFDAQRLVIWNMGAIAASGNPKALQLFRKVLLASASIPVVFPPQFFKVEAGGRPFEEMHVDGGTMALVMLYNAALKPFTELQGLAAGVAGRAKVLYIIRNERTNASWEKVEPRLLHMATRALDTLFKAQGVYDVYRLFAFCQRDKIDFNLAAIPQDYPLAPEDAFDQAYMNRLFDFGFELARKGYQWGKYPPGLAPEAVLPTPKQGG